MTCWCETLVRKRPVMVNSFIKSTSTDKLRIVWMIKNRKEFFLKKKTLSATCSHRVKNNITNMSGVAFEEMEYHLFHRGMPP